MEENDNLASGQNERAAERRGADPERADGGYTDAESLVRDDSVIDASATPADRRPRANEGGAGAGVADEDAPPSIGDQFGEAAGGISGVLAGAAIGSLGGPIGTVIGGIAGAVGGWWTGRAISEAASNFSHSHDEEFRSDFATRADAVASTPYRSYELVRPAYQLGFLASRNPEYAGRSFAEIEPHLERGWNDNAATEAGDWSAMREYARTAYTRGVDSGSANAPAPSGAMGDAGANADAVERLASPLGSSFTRQGDVPLNSSATDTAGSSRTADNATQVSGEPAELRGSGVDRGPAFTDPPAGEGVENIGSSGLSPRGEQGPLNEKPRGAEHRDEGEGTAQKY